MFTIPNYHILNKIHEGPNSTVYRAQRLLDQVAVILKVVQNDYPSQEEANRYKQEYDIAQLIDSDHIVKIYALEQCQNKPFIVLEDFGGESLKVLLNIYPFSFIELLTISIKLVEALAIVHRAKIIHKDINPSNVIFNPNTQQVKLTDFSISTLLPSENPVLKSPIALEGTIAYMSPEQTGRMNRPMDYRTDYYALGVTLYELFTSKLPFDANDAIELVHCHLAKQPVPPYGLMHVSADRQILRNLSAIILKLLEKTPENRYQSLWGIKTDLQACLDQFQAGKINTNFIAGQHDVSNKFHIPQKLYGRNLEIKMLLDAFEWACFGNSEMLLVSGYSGIGKTSLVKEIYKPVTEKRGYFINGKFNQLQRNVPYFGVVQALRNLIQQLLTEEETQLQHWQKTIQNVLGKNRTLMTDIIPELEWIIGSQTSQQEVISSELRNRVNLVFKKLIQIFCRPEHPLVIFLDDLQWADAASLKLLTLIAADIPYLFLIGAYRDNEVSPTHPLRLTLEKIQQAGVTVNTIHLTPLTLPYIVQFIADTLNASVQSVKPLAKLIVTKTAGNPFFMGEFLKSLYAEKLLNFNEQQRIWEWQLEHIKLRDITDNVVELMTDKVRKLGDKTQQALKLAACVGNQFSLHILVIFYERSPQEISKHLWEGIEYGLIQPLPINQFQAASSHTVTTEYKFSHDRIHQAVYSLLTEEEKQANHWQIGQLLLDTMPVEPRKQNIFAIVDQLNEGMAMIDHDSERDELAQLNLIAGKKAKISAAYEPAFEYLDIGMKLLADSGWQRQYELTLALIVEAIEIAYLNANFDEVEKLAAIVSHKTRKLLDKVKVYEIQIKSYTAQNRLLEAIQTGLNVLKLLGFKFPQYPTAYHTLQGKLSTKWHLQFYPIQAENIELTEAIKTDGRQIKHLIYLPKMKNPLKLAATRILMSVGLAAYSAMPKLYTLVTCKQVNLSLCYGNTHLSAYAYAAYGQYLCGNEGDIHAGCQFGHLALKVLDRFEAKELRARTAYIVNSFIRHWKVHLRDTLQPLLDTWQIGLETGELDFAGYAVFSYAAHAYFCGEDLARLSAKMADYSQSIRKFRQERALHLHEIYRQAVLNLQDAETKQPTQLIGEACNQQKMITLYQQANDRSALYHVAFNQLVLNYLFEDYKTASNSAALAAKYLDGTHGSLPFALFHFYDALNRLALYPSTAIAKRKRWLKKIKAHHQKIKQWVKYNPMNYSHKSALLSAEIARVYHHEKEAREYYDQAISLAKQHRYLNEEALAYELAAKFYLGRKQFHVARYYLHNAHYAYLRWGAAAKVRQLETRYARFLAPHDNQLFYPNPYVTSTTTQPNKSIDFISILKASQAIAGEIMLNQLLEKLMQIVMENAGAQRGVLILEKNGQWVIEAQGSLERHEIKVLQSVRLEDIPLEDATLSIPLTLVNYVMRIQKSMVLNNAAQEGKFTRDPHMARYQIKSASCVPLLNQGKLTGVLYLENNLIANAFTPEYLEVLNLLSLQMAISIENAKLYADTKGLNTQLQQSEERFRIIAETTPVALLISRFSDGLILYANAQAATLYGVPTQQLIENYATTDFYYYPEDREKLLEKFSEHRYLRNYEVKFKKIDQMPFWVAIFLQPILFKNQQALFAAIHDITEKKQVEQERIRFTQELASLNKKLENYSYTLEQKVEERTRELRKANQELQRLATLDGLTQVGNRRQLDAYLDEMWQKLGKAKQPLSLILCDIDYFKAYNDTYGHQAGDDCLKRVAQAMDQTVNHPDLIARYGGEEFTIILPNKVLDQAEKVAQAVHEAVAQLKIPHANSQANEFISLSMGVASMIPTIERSESVLSNTADQSLYQAKNSGRNKIVCAR